MSGLSHWRGGSVVDFNAKARRATLSGAAWLEADKLARVADSDADALALLADKTGDVAAAYLHGHTDIEGELLKVAGAALAWLDRLGHGRAA